MSEIHECLPLAYRVSTVDAQSASCIISGSYDGNIRIWSGETGLFILRTPFYIPMRDPSASPSGDMQCQATIHAHSNGVNAVACLPSGQGQGLIMTAGTDHQVKLWQASSTASGKPGSALSWACHLVAQYTAHTDAVEGLAVNPAGDR